MALKFRTDAPPASEQAIQSLEQKLGIKLPADYAHFLLIQNGGSVDFSNKYYYQLPPEFPDSALLLESFLSVEEVETEYERVREAFCLSYVPIGVDDFGNYVCLGIAAKEQGAVFFLDHELVDEETEQNLVVRIADSFGVFVSGLTTDKGP
jgi:cell wall assembly regulator SMI1